MWGDTRSVHADNPGWRDMGSSCFHAWLGTFMIAVRRPCLAMHLQKPYPQKGAAGRVHRWPRRARGASGRGGAAGGWRRRPARCRARGRPGLPALQGRQRYPGRRERERQRGPQPRPQRPAGAILPPPGGAGAARRQAGPPAHMGGCTACAAAQAPRVGSALRHMRTKQPRQGEPRDDGRPGLRPGRFSPPPTGPPVP